MSDDHPSDGLWCECLISLTWKPAPPAEAAPPGLEREALMLLTAFNQMEAMHDLDSATGAENRRLERLESKLDLALYLLARALAPSPATVPREVRLSPVEIHWRDDAPPGEGMPLLLEIHASDALPLALRLPVVAQAPGDGWARARFSGLSEHLSDALHQFVFRRHRQAIRAKLG